jgi:hypothetical protein
MAVERYPHGLPVDELIDSLVIGEIMGLEKVMDEIHIRQQPGPVDIPAINRPHFDNSVRIAGGKRQWGAVEVDNHPGDGSINIGCDPVFKSEYTTGTGIAIITEFIVVEQ